VGVGRQERQGRQGGQRGIIQQVSSLSTPSFLPPLSLLHTQCPIFSILLVYLQHSARADRFGSVEDCR
jgi:hypothetical protein